MKPEQWRPSDALRKRKISFLSVIEVSGLASLMIFFLALLMLPPFLPYPHYGSGVDLAPVDHPKAMPGALKEDALQVLLTRDGTIYCGGRKVAANELASVLQQGLREGSEKKVYLKADARARYGDVKAVLDLIHLAGIENVALITEETRHNPAP